MFLQPKILRIMLAMALGIAAVLSAPRLAMAGASENAAQQMLQDGLDALDDGRTDIARKIFETLQATYPGTPAARRAADEMRPKANSREANERADAPRDAGGGERKGARMLSAAEREDYVRRLARDFLTEVGDRVFFAENSTAIGGRARAVIEAQARWLKRSPSVDVTIIGRADEGTSAAEAAAISRERAKAVEAMLIANGVSPERIKAEGRGSSDPVANCRSAMCQAQNRHAESQLRLASPRVKISGGGGIEERTPRGAVGAAAGAEGASLAR